MTLPLHAPGPLFSRGAALKRFLLAILIGTVFPIPSWAQDRALTPQDWAMSPRDSALTPQERVRAEYLLATRLPCLGCHTLDGRGGAIGPDLGQVGARRTAAEIRAILLDPAKALPGTVMPRTPMTGDTRERIVGYLASRGTVIVPRSEQRPQLPRVRTTGSPSDALLYAERCAACHGPRGKGDGPNARYLMKKPAVHQDAAQMGRRTDDRLFDGIFGGGLVLGISPSMPAYGESLTREQIWSLVGYIRELCRCRQPGWANGR